MNRRSFTKHSNEEFPLSASAAEDAPLNSERTGRAGSLAVSKDRTFSMNRGEQDGSSSSVQEQATHMDMRGQEPSSPRLLMPPPRTRSEEVQFQLDTAARRALAAIGINPGTVQFATHLAIFLFKLVTLAQPCWPFVASLQVAMPLMVLAALELGWPSFAGSAGIHVFQHGAHSRHMSTSARILLFGLHFAVLFLARRWNVLCVGARRERWAEW